MVINRHLKILLFSGQKRGKEISLIFAPILLVFKKFDQFSKLLTNRQRTKEVVSTHQTLGERCATRLVFAKKQKRNTKEKFEMSKTWIYWNVCLLLICNGSSIDPTTTTSPSSSIVGTSTCIAACCVVCKRGPAVTAQQ